MTYQFNIVLPWDRDRLRDDPRLRWAVSFLRDRNTPLFVYNKPPAKTIERVHFLTKQLCAKKRRWVACFGNCTVYTNKLFHYVGASFVLTSGLSAEVTIPKKLIDFAFSFGDNMQFGYASHPFQICGLLIIPHFDPMYPGYQKARPKIAELLSERKIENKPCMIEIYIPQKLPSTFEELSKFTPGLIDIVGSQAKDLFGDAETKFIIIEAEEL